ncbi:MAG: hypothetical protein N2B06_16920 [Clostridium sp.]
MKFWPSDNPSPNYEGQWSLSMKFPNIDSKAYIENNVIQAKEGCTLLVNELEFFEWCVWFDSYSKTTISAGNPRFSYKDFISIKVQTNDAGDLIPGKYWDPSISFRVSGSSTVAKLNSTNTITGEKLKTMSEGLNMNHLIRANICIWRCYTKSSEGGPTSLCDRVILGPPPNTETPSPDGIVDDDGTFREHVIDNSDAIFTENMVQQPTFVNV